jgi:hypothetical protein
MCVEAKIFSRISSLPLQPEKILDIKKIKLNIAHTNFLFRNAKK